MSYSFIITAPTKDEASGKVAAAFDAVVAQQNVHKADRNAAVSAVDAFIYMLGDPGDGEEVLVTVNGYLSWRGPQEDANFFVATVNISARIHPKGDQE